MITNIAIMEEDAYPFLFDDNFPDENSENADSSHAAGDAAGDNSGNFEEEDRFSREGNAYSDDYYGEENANFGVDDFPLPSTLVPDTESRPGDDSGFLEEYFLPDENQNSESSFSEAYENPNSPELPDNDFFQQNDPITEDIPDYLLEDLSGQDFPDHLFEDEGSESQIYSPDEEEGSESQIYVPDK